MHEWGSLRLVNAEVPSVEVSGFENIVKKVKIFTDFAQEWRISVDKV